MRRRARSGGRPRGDRPARGGLGGGDQAPRPGHARIARRSGVHADVGVDGGRAEGRVAAVGAHGVRRRVVRVRARRRRSLRPRGGRERALQPARRLGGRAARVHVPAHGRLGVSRRPLAGRRAPFESACVTVRANYAEADFARAVELVSAEAAPAALAARLGIDWDYLAWLGLGLAEELLEGEPAERDSLVGNGAEAFAAGFLIGAFLPGVAPRTELGSDLRLAVESVRAPGRHAIIADFCALGGVGGLEDVYASSLLDAIAAPQERRPALREPLTRLFESGLATG